MLIKKSWPKVRVVNRINGKTGTITTNYVVDPRPVGKREAYPTKLQADNRAYEIRIQYQTKRSIGLSERAETEYMLAMSILSPLNVSLIEAARIVEKDIKKVTDKLVNKAISEFVTYKDEEYKRNEIRKRTMEEIKNRLKVFGAHFGERQLCSITHIEIDDWLHRMNNTSITRKNNLSKIGQLFRWSIKREYAHKNPCEIIEIKSDRISDEVKILTVKECKALLTAVQTSPYRKAIEPFVIVSMFCGLRPGEAESLTWEDFQNHQIRIHGSRSKVKETRFVHPVKDVWDALMKLKGKGRICAVNHRKQWDAIKKAAGYMTDEKPWPHDVLRHCFASYWLPIHQDRPRLAEEMGNSLGVIKKHYRRAIQKSDAIAFWKLISPAKDSLLKVLMVNNDAEVCK